MRYGLGVLDIALGLYLVVTSEKASQADSFLHRWLKSERRTRTVLIFAGLLLIAVGAVWILGFAGA